MWKGRNREKRMIIYANICKQSPNEFLKTLIIEVHYEAQTDQCWGGWLPELSSTKEAQSNSSFLCPVNLCILSEKHSQVHLSKSFQAAAPTFPCLSVCLHISLLAFRRSERPKVHRINCRWGRLIGLKIETYGFFQDLDFLNTCLK